MKTILALVTATLLAIWPVAAAITTSPGSGTTSGGAAGGGFTSSRPVYVAATGNDAAAGTVTAPVVTLQRAATILGGSGTIIVRGGTYFDDSLNLSNVYDLQIRNYNNEIPSYWFGTLVASNSFSALSNGIFTTTLSGHALNCLVMLTNWWDDWSPVGRGIYLWQTNVPYGAVSYMRGGMSPISRSGDTNRLEHTPLFRAGTVSSMINSNGCWAMSGTTLYVKFASSNVMGGVYISDTNVNASVVYGGTEATRISVSGVRTYFGRHGFNYAGCGKAEFRRCLAVGAGYDGFSGDDQNQPQASVTGDVDVLHCEAAGCNGFQFHANGDFAHLTYSSVLREGNYWHDYLREGASARQSVFQTVSADMAVGGRDGHYGFIDDAGHSIYMNCYGASNTVANWQMGQVFGWSSVQRIFSPVEEESNVGFQLDDFNDHLWLINGQMANAGVGMSVGNNTSHSARILGSMYFTSQNTDVGSSAQSLNAANFQVGHINYGWGPDSLIGNSAYSAPFLIHKQGLVGQQFIDQGTLTISGASSLSGLATFGGGVAWTTNSPTTWATAAAVGGETYLYNSNSVLTRIKANPFSTVFTATNTVP